MWYDGIFCGRLPAKLSKKKWNALENMKQKGMIEYTQNEIKVVERRALVALLHHYTDGGE